MRRRRPARRPLVPLGVAAEIHELAATELVAAYLERRLSPLEVVDALAGRIERANPELGAFTALCLERARAEAADAERAYGGDGAAGPLAGVPFAAKDIFDTADLRTTQGSPMFADNVPGRDAPAVAALRRAGAILIGKTQTHEFAWGVTSINEAMGSSRNPWDPSRVPGGSSGGSGVALAAELVPLALGSDTGGSIRIPAAFCGVMGLKPTYGRVDATGVWPLAPSLDHVGPMARAPDDLALALAALGVAGTSSAPPLDGTTVVACPDLHEPAPVAAVERAYGDALRALEGAGARVVERPFPPADRVLDTFRVIQACEAIRVHERAGLWPQRADEYGDDVRRLLEDAAELDPGSYVDAGADREALRAELGRLVEGGAVLVTPVAAVPPARTDQLRRFRSAVLPYTTPQDLAGLPACAVRAGFDDEGLPVGVQLTAAAWREGDALRAARALFEATPDVQARRPPEPAA